MKKPFNYIFFASCFIFSFVFFTNITAAYSIADWASTGTSPWGIAVDSFNNLYTADADSDSVSKITPEGIRSVFGSGTVGDWPWGIIVDVYNNVYTANYSLNSISKISSNGNITTPFAATGSGPTSLNTDSLGNIYTANFADSTITKINSDGSTINPFATTGNGPMGIVLDSSGNIYTANYSSNNVSKITPAGISTILGNTGNVPFKIVVDQFGNVYTANSGSNNVSKITLAGVSTILGNTETTPFDITIDSLGNIYTANADSNSVTKITNPTITEITPVTTPTSDGDNLQYTFASNSAGAISYGGSCISDTTVALVGETTVVLHSLGEGTYDDCTITVTDEFGPSNVLPISTFTIDTTDPIISIVSVGGDSNPSYATTENMPNIVFTTEAGDTVAISDWTCSPTPATGTTVTCVPDSELSLGSHTVNITMEDAASNSATDTLTFIVKKRTASVGGYLKPVTPLTTTSEITKFTFTKNLKFLTLDGDVKELQKFLNTHGYPVASTGAGSNGLETTRFGLLTQKALIKFQKANNITPAVGYFGPITRALVNSLNK